MPFYDFRCRQCQKKFEIQLSYAEFGKAPVQCPFCGATEVERMIRGVRVIGSERDRLVTAADASGEDDPRTLGRMMRTAQEQSGADMAPEFDEVVDRLEQGDSVESIDRDFAENE